MSSRITLSLISHTNVGKTTLLRTLLRRDVGEVLDREHVTDHSEAHTLIETGAARLGPMITHRFPLEAYQQAFDLLVREPKEAYKVVFTMD